MTAMAAVIKSDRVHVLADGAKCNMENGELMGVSNRIIPLGRLNAVFVASSPGLFAEVTFASVCGEWDHNTFDGLITDLPDVMAFYQEETRIFESDLLIAGFSEEKRRPVVAGWHSRKEPYLGMEPETLYFHESGSASFGLPSLPPAESFDLVKHGIPAFDEARREKLNLWFGFDGQVNMGYRIGGSLGHVELTEGGIRSAWLKHWQDRVGEPIDPFKAGQIAMPF